MNKDLIQDIGDDEIRIISQPRSKVSPNVTESQVTIGDNKQEKEGKRENSRSSSSSKTYKIIIGLMVVLILGLIIFILWKNHQDDEDFVPQESVVEALEEIEMAKDEPVTPSFVEISQVDTELSPLYILTPKNATPHLEVGQESVKNPNAKMLFQAADVRGDNYEINGAFVCKGELLSRGQSKSGYCAIIDGEINIGVAEATPLLEKAIETDGYFFRQYPLVAGGQIVENKLQNRSYRKALAKMGEKTVVIVSQKKLTLHDFSQALIDAGISEAIYLIGSNAYGFAEDASGKKLYFGDDPENANTKLEKINFIVWE